MSGSRRPLELVHRRSAAGPFPIAVLQLTGEAMGDEAAARLLQGGDTSEHASPP